MLNLSVCAGVLRARPSGLRAARAAGGGGGGEQAAPADRGGVGPGHRQAEDQEDRRLAEGGWVGGAPTNQQTVPYIHTI